jgi:DNA-binding NtrC family response regulator
VKVRRHRRVPRGPYLFATGVQPLYRTVEDAIADAVEKCAGNYSEAARLLQVTRWKVRTTMRTWAERHGRSVRGT